MVFNFVCNESYELKVKVCSFVEIHARFVEWIYYYCVLFQVVSSSFLVSRYFRVIMPFDIV